MPCTLRCVAFWCALLLHNLGGSNPHVNFSLSSNVAEATFSPKRKDGQGVFCEEESERSAGKISPKQCVNQRWRRYWVTRPKNGETYANRISYRQIFRGKRPIGRVDVIRVGMDGTVSAITGGSTVDTYR